MTVRRIPHIPMLLLSLLMTGCTAQNDISDAVQPPEQWSEAEEINHWIYAQMNHYYLWRDDLPDSLSCDYKATPKEFYESLLSSKDRFSYLTQKSGSRCAEHADVGFTYQPYKTPAGEILWEVLYVTSSAAREKGLSRGDIVKPSEISSDKIELIRYECDENGTVRTKLMDYSAATTRAGLNETVYLDSVYNINGKRIGYLCYLEYEDPEDYFVSFEKFSHYKIDNLILDLRYNPGGLVSTCKKLCNLIVSSDAYGQLFQQCSYNDIIAKENIDMFGDERTYSYFNAPVTSGAIFGTQYSYLGLSDIYILTSRYTASASESTISSLSPYMNVTVIGENSVGKGVGMQTIASSKYKYALVPITFRFYNAEGESIPDDGIVPDYYVPDGYNTIKRELGDVSEPLLAKALELITGETTAAPTNHRRNLKEALLLTQVGEPSYMIDFKNKHYNESN